ncbi:hypothetical protein MBLNU230_g3281t1 [Neophaeotheca triangularis]
MSKSVNSPTARLLQSSRLFSLPRPLPQNAPANASATGAYRGSDTATTLYPTHQAIITPASSLHRGDWGVKRALPSKATKNTNTPVIRIKAGDNFEHITSFESAADHERTLAKWNELGVPMLQRKPRNTVSNEGGAYGEPREVQGSVFEDNFDNTDAAVTDDITGEKTRWKYRGPWLAGMLKGDFDIWVKKSVGKRGAEWREFLRTSMAEDRQRDVLRLRREEGNFDEVATSEPLPSITDAELATHEKELRDSHMHDGLASELTRLITRFLDLPALTNSQPSSSYAKTTDLAKALTTMTANEGPPSTHPSAGLSHLRTSSHIFNHPLHGPQAFPTPVPARVLRPAKMRGAPDNEAKLGVAGFVARDPKRTQTWAKSAITPGSNDADQLIQQLDPDRVGGNVVQVHPRHAEVDDQGRVHLNFDRGDKEAIAVKEGNVEWIHQQKERSSMGLGGARGASVRMPPPPPGTAGNANYGAGLPNHRRLEFQRARGNANQYRGEGAGAARAPRVRGFDETEVGGRGREAIERITQLMPGRGGEGSGNGDGRAR